MPPPKRHPRRMKTLGCVLGLSSLALLSACTTPTFSSNGDAGAGGSAAGSAGQAGNAGDAGQAGRAGNAGDAGRAGSAGLGGSGGLSGAAGTAGSSAAGGSSGQAGGAGNGGVQNASCEWLDTACQGESCCASTVVPGGIFMMGRGTGAVGDVYPAGYADEVPAHSVTVTDFALDKYEVTVGRFRQFVAAYGAGWRPTAGDGAHPRIPGSGWDATWNTNLPEDASTLVTHLKCDASYSNWTDTVADAEAYPINCVNWYEAMAFCVWDGGRLPTEAEWEYAAAGGAEERLFPWGGALPSAEAARANTSYSDASPFTAVGSHPTGGAKWGQQDMAGSLWEWTLDSYSPSWYASVESSGTDVCYLTGSAGRVVRGSSWYGSDASLRGTSRLNQPPVFPSPTAGTVLGVRCARTE